MSLDLLVLGNLLVDDVVYEDGRTRMAQPGGAVLYAALGAALWDVHVGVASWRGDDYPTWALDALAARGIDVSGVLPLGGPSLRTWLLYEGRRRQIVHRLDCPSHAEVSPTADRLPSGWLSARAFHLAPMPLDVQRGLLKALGGRETLLSVDPYELFRPDTLEGCLASLVGADVLFLSEDELELPGVREDVRGVLRTLCGGRLHRIVFKRGVLGGLLFDAQEDTFAEWTARTERLLDPTGAGDAFAGGVLAGWLRGDPTPRALGRGVVSASFAIEDWGAAGLLEATPAAAAARFDRWFPA
jgi:sugar/nucleoside kinase (ribokinase family)